MKLTTKLLRHIHGIFGKDGDEFLALRINYNGVMTWEISNEILTTQVTGGTGANLKIALGDYTISGLASFIALQPGYSIPFVNSSEVATLKAVVLIDGSGTPSSSNGDHIKGYSSLLWAFFDAVSVQLFNAADQLTQMVNQMSITDASDSWLDEHGSYYNVKRKLGETDEVYGMRIIAEVLRPRGNNKAIEAAILEATGVSSTVVDVGALPYAGAITSCAGLFDVYYEPSSEVDAGGVFAARVRSIIESMRDGGTYLRNLRLYLIYNGAKTYNGAVAHNSIPI